MFLTVTHHQEDTIGSHVKSLNSASFKSAEAFASLNLAFARFVLFFSSSFACACNLAVVHIDHHACLS